MRRKEGLGVKFWGVGGREVQVPIASFWFGGSVARSVRRFVDGSIGCLCTYCMLCLAWRDGREGEARTMCGWSGSVETGLEARRRSVGALKAGRMQRVERKTVFDSIVM